MHKHEWYISVMKSGEVFARCKDPDCEIILADYRIDRRLDVHSALRTVARAVAHFTSDDNMQHWDFDVRNVPDSYYAIKQALDALPQWVLDSESEEV